MKKFLLIFLILLIFNLQSVQAANLPEPHTSEGFGVNIHSGSFTIKDFDMMQQAGFKFFRTDLNWHEKETKKGIYDLSVFDIVLEEAYKRDMRPLLILDYGNPLYGCTMNINNSECLQGFKNFVRHVVTRYKKYNVIWEIWNEPDCGYFWRPQPAHDDYMNLVKEIVPVIKQADPDSTVIAPAVGRLDPPYTFLKECFERGLLDYVDAVSVHPYRDIPETVIQDYANLRKLIRQYSPDKPDIPIIAGEWGESSGEAWRSQEIQAKYILRQHLINLYEGIPVTIWYKWKDDGTNLGKKDHNWGLVTLYEGNKKQALNSFQEMRNHLQQVKFVKRFDYPDPDVFILLFDMKDSNKKLIMGWTVGTSKKIEFSDGNFVTLTDMPDYLIIDKNPEFVNKSSIESSIVDEEPEDAGNNSKSLLENLYVFFVAQIFGIK